MSRKKPEATREQRFADLYRSNYADVLRFIVRRTDPGSAEDVAHECFLVAWRRFDVVPTDHEEARAWLFTAARNCLLNNRRGLTRRNALEVRIATEFTTGSDTGDHLWPHRLDLVDAWKALSPEQQEVISLTVWEGMSSASAGRVLGISAAAFRLRLHRARSELDRLLQKAEITARSRTAHTNKELRK